VSILENFFKSKTTNYIVSLLLVLSILGLIVIMIIDLMPLMKDVVVHITDEQVVTRDIYDYGAKGIFILAMLQALQVITTVFPSAAIQILSGLTYGLFEGMLICLLGLIIGNAIVFTLLRQFNKTFRLFRRDHEKIKKEKKWDFSFLAESKNATKIAFILYLIPGIPNGILPYIFVKTKMRLLEYLLVIIVAGAPSILFYSLIGERLSSGDPYTALIILIIFLVLGLVVVLFRKKIIELVKKHS